jgi:hypothetical protein
MLCSECAPVYGCDFEWDGDETGYCKFNQKREETKMITNNENFAAFLQSKDRRYYAERIKDGNYCFFKVPYDGDCDFVHVIHTYTGHYNPEGKPELNDRSELGGIYVYSLGLLFNAGYELRGFLAPGYKALDAKEYYGRLKDDVSAETVRRVEAGLFDRAGAETLVGENDRDIRYYREYREREFAEQDFLDGKRFDKPEICIEYATRCENDIAAVLEYLRSPAGAVNARADAFMESEKAMIYKRIIGAEIRFGSFKEIEANKSNPLHYQREIRRAVQAACVKTVNVAFERDGRSATVKTGAERLGLNGYVADWDIAAADRAAFKAMFGYKHGGDARMNEIISITHGKKELYNKAAFEKTLL